MDVSTINVEEKVKKNEEDCVLSVRNLHTSFFTDAGEVSAVNGVSFNLAKGKILGIVGESGSGKSVTAYSIMQILADTGKVTEGKILYKGKNVLDFGKKEMHDPMYVPMKEKEIAAFLRVGKEDRDELKNILLSLENDGEIECTSRGRYKVAEAGLIGQFISNAKGFGFVMIEGREEDIFIPEDATGGAFLMDTVAVELKEEKAGKRVEGRIRKIIMRGMTEVVGT